MGAARDAGAGAIGLPDCEKFIPLYPVFGRPNQQGITLSEETLYLWEQVDIFLDNTAGSQVRNACMRQQLPFMLVAHMATLMGWPDNCPRGMLPGQLTSVSKGSVSLGMQSLIAQPATALATGTRALSCVVAALLLATAASHSWCNHTMRRSFDAPGQIIFPPKRSGPARNEVHCPSCCIVFAVYEESCRDEMSLGHYWEVDSF